MAINVLKDCKFYVGGYDFSGQMNKLEISVENEKLNSTTFGADTKHYEPGLQDVKLSHAGFVSMGVGEVDDIIADALSVKDQILTTAAESGADGEFATSFKGMIAQYVPGGKVGELYGFVVEASASSAIAVRGTISATGAKTSSDTGTIRQLGAVGAAQSLYCVQHVIAVSGTDPTLDTIVESDDGVGFGSGDTKATFAEASAIGSEWIQVGPAAITDDYWRVGWTIGGTDTPTFTFLVLIAIH